ncbi:MAG: phosphotransferase [Chloroflexi bacterium]|nr:MAG: phosphotransferase [Chloroflexota bacterium]
MSEAVARHWRSGHVDVEFLPVGAGSYHWRASTPRRPPLFVTVDDLDRKPFLGADADTVYARLRSALETARALRQSGMEFVVAPIEGRDGNVLSRIGRRYALAVYPYLGEPRAFGNALTAEERVALKAMLVRLHAAPKAVASLPRSVPAEVPFRRELELALDSVNTAWEDDQYSRAARPLLAANAAAIWGWLERFDELVRISSADNVDVVITHGEPHSGNIVRSGTHFALVDWDTVGLAPRERDLWLVGGGEPQLCELYRLRWRLDDLSSSVRVLLSPHDPDGDPERALRVLRISIEREPFTRD